MNERIQELISAYLHRGSTPEQERELFDACSRNPETAELLRQHLVLSLKLHQLRDETEVPPDLHNNVLRRINALEAERLREEERRIVSAPVVPAAAGQTRGRFGWTHLLGTGLAGAAVVALFLSVTDTAEPDLASQTPPAPDTVVMVRTDTLLREVERPVYIVRETAPHALPGTPAADAPEQLATRTVPTDAPAAVRPDAPRPLEDTSERPGAARAETRTSPPDAVVLADNLPPATREEKTQNYLEQYNSMLVSVESVRISSQDRLH